ncbi:MAG: heat-inducible transcription repressor [Candidatus Phytoplasma cynodontis]|uniref:heat-inducible transcriptional repressor HrcA n=1 Tax='Cynodon dactylon' phytoplasma TaxID=295320 RepID=UPI001265D2D3|nr:heat-inducible transcriptional repressor HrcA ['Cynodon dactylon' phytoplasma]KAB8121808.1 heat-inducible transcription repressor HrcA ['Cynodon dactylon' phytoplasma]WIA07725.1 MAG: heat-inducible transcription repressor [Candidatus Phytoplasma cynodontis]
MLSNRKKLILKAVVENYSRKNQPIGSKFLTSLSYLKFSSATIRYDMVQLEKEGYLIKNHKSSGRIPSLKGYVFYLKNLMTREESKTPLKIISLFEDIIKKKNIDKEKLIKEILELLCNLTNYVTLNVVPDIFETSKINKIDLIFLGFNQVIVLVITDKGNLRYRNIFLSKEEYLFFISLEKLVDFLNYLFFGKYLFEALEILKNDNIKKKIEKKCFQYSNFLIQFLRDTFYCFSSNNSYIYGISNFFNKYNFENNMILKELVKIFDTKELCKIFFNSSYSKNNVCKLVNQITLVTYSNFIIISVPYQISDNERGFIGVLGPLVMKYDKIIPILEYLSAHLTQLFENNCQRQFQIY